VHRANLKFNNLSTTTSRVSVRNKCEFERGRKTNRKRIRSETQGFVLPRFGSRKPTPRWGGHKDRVSFNPFPLSNGPSDRVSFSSQSNGNQTSLQGPPHNWCLLPWLQLRWSQERMRKRSNPSARVQMNTSVALSSHYLIWSDSCWDHASSPKVLQEETASAKAAYTWCRSYHPWSFGVIAYLKMKDRTDLKMEWPFSP
jgi:hypothetical protein